MNTQRHSERGAVAPLLLVLVTVILLMTGLAVDGARILAARREAIDTAQSAARAGAQALDPNALRQGHATLDPQTAVTEAEAFLAASGHHGTVLVAGGRVQVTVTITRPMALLSAVGISERTVTGVGTARPVRGINEAEQ